MPATLEVLLLTGQAATERAVGQVAKSAPEWLARVGVCRDVKELTKRLEGGTVAVALIDLGAQPLQELAGLEPLVRRFSATRFIVLCDELRQEVVVEAMQVGVRNCVVRADLQRTLPAVFKRLVHDGAGPQQPLGRVITVLSASGGCGGTTIATNLAEELSLHAQRPTLLIDLDRHFGAVASYLGLSGRYGIADVLAHRGAVDAQLIATTATVFSERLHVMLSPATVSFEEPAPLALERFDQALDAAQHAYQHTVVDAPRVPIELAATLGRASVLTLVVFELAVIDIRCARQLLQMLTARGVARERVVALANRYRKRNPMLSFEDAQKALDGFRVEYVSNDYESAMRSVNLGKPLAEVAPRSPMRRDLRSLVAVVESCAEHTLA